MKTKPIPRGEFNDAQNALMRRGNPEDPCGRCGCRRKHHLPKPTFAYYDVTPVLAPTCCECKLCFCFCVAFVEPFAGQRFASCVYEPRPKPAALAPASGHYEYENDAAIPFDPYDKSDKEKAQAIFNGLKRARTKKPNDEQPSFTFL